jgi:hypothetical protein
VDTSEAAVALATTILTKKIGSIGGIPAEVDRVLLRLTGSEDRGSLA